MRSKPFALSLGLLWLTGCSLPRVALLKDPLTIPEHEHLAATYKEQGKWTLAEREYRAAVRQDKRSVSNLVNLGHVCFEQKKYAQARHWYLKARRQAKKDGGILNNIAMTYLAEKRYPKALPFAEKAVLRGGPALPYSLDTLAQVRRAIGDCAGAEEAWSKAAAWAPNAEFREQLAQIRAAAPQCPPLRVVSTTTEISS